MEFERNKLLEINEKLNVINNSETPMVLNGTLETNGDDKQPVDVENPIYTQKNIKLLEVK